ncbi:hypothetical protein H0H87_010728, partial [Tephrocybe sp. NHM501043]
MDINESRETVDLHLLSFFIFSVASLYSHYKERVPSRSFREWGKKIAWRMVPEPSEEDARHTAIWIFRSSCRFMLVYVILSALLDYLEESALFQNYQFAFLSTTIRIFYTSKELLAALFMVEYFDRRLPYCHSILPGLKWTTPSKKPTALTPTPPAPTPAPVPPAPGTWQHLNAVAATWRNAPTDSTEKVRRLQVYRNFVTPWNELSKVALKIHDDCVLKNSISRCGNRTTEDTIEAFLVKATSAIEGILRRAKFFADNTRISVMGKSSKTIDVIRQWLQESEDMAEIKRRERVLHNALDIWDCVTEDGFDTLAQAIILVALRCTFSSSTSSHATFEDLLAKSVEIMKRIRVQQRHRREARQRAHALELRQRRAEQQQAQRRLGS